MHEQDLNTILADSVHDAIALRDDLTQRRIAHLRYDPAREWKIIQAIDGSADAFDENLR